jgi:hypothetical protein
VPAAVARNAHGSVGATLSAAMLAHTGHPRLAMAIHEAARAAFFHGFHAGHFVAAGVTAAGVLMAFALLPAHPTVEVEQSATHAADSRIPVAADN